MKSFCPCKWRDRRREKLTRCTENPAFVVKVSGRSWCPPIFASCILLQPSHPRLAYFHWHVRRRNNRTRGFHCGMLAVTQRKLGVFHSEDALESAQGLRSYDLRSLCFFLAARCTCSPTMNRLFQFYGVPGLSYDCGKNALHRRRCGSTRRTIDQRHVNVSRGAASFASWTLFVCSMRSLFLPGGHEAVVLAASAFQRPRRYPNYPFWGAHRGCPRDCFVATNKQTSANHNAAG